MLFMRLRTKIMPVEMVKHITRQMLRDRPEALFAFGDNMEGTGYDGQARECRGEPNAVGIPTKWRASMDQGAFFRDEHFPKVKSAIDAAFLRLVDHLRAGGVIVLPRDGIGTGLAQLPVFAPRIHDFIHRSAARLIEISKS